MDAITDNLDLFWRGILTTLEICVWAAVLSLVIGTVIAIFRVSPLPPLRAVGTTWINSVAVGQAEAARAIGLPFGKSLRHIVLPQAFRTVLPPMGNVYIAMIKNSAIVGAFGVSGDLFWVGQTLTGARGYGALPVLLGVTAGYLILTLPAGAAVAQIERRVVIAR
jgi:glutamate transport system permease protein